jgi:chaperone modulatory protein CbpM
MRLELTEVLWFEEHAMSLHELAELCDLPQSLLEELISAGAIVPLDASHPEPRFGAQALSAARSARRLRSDFDLDAPGLLLALSLLDRIHDLERQIQALRARSPGKTR